MIDQSNRAGKMIPILQTDIYTYSYNIAHTYNVPLAHDLFH